MAAPSRPTLSLCMMVSRSTSRVAALLNLMRSVTDEIVLGVDDRVDEDQLWPLQEVADVVVRFPYLGWVNRPIAWLHSLASGYWILRLDDDEIPSQLLVEALPDVVKARTITHAFVRRLWLYPDAETYLDEPPWRTEDLQPRLLRNDPALVWYTGIPHLPMELYGPRRYLLDAPMYHHELLRPLDERRAKVRRYEEHRPGLRLVGAAFNAAYYLPEIRQGVRTAPVPEPDRTTIASILEGPQWPARRPLLRPVRSASREEVDAHWFGAPTDEGMYEAALDLVERDLPPMLAGVEYDLEVRVENRGTRTWPWGLAGRPEFRVSYRWLDSDGNIVVQDGLRTPMPEPLPPGASCQFPADVIAPATTGAHTLVLDLLHEDVRWLGREVLAEIEVHARHRIGIIGESEESAAAGAATVAGLLPWVEPVVFASQPNAVRARIGYATAQGARDYILATDESASQGRFSLLLRATRLVRGARRLRQNREPRAVSPAGQSFLEALSQCDALLVAGPRTLRGHSGGREKLQQTAAVRAAAALGLHVAIAGGAQDRARKGPRSLALRGTFTIAAENGNGHAAIAEAVRKLGALLSEHVEP